jgi:hypothetical protein
MRRSQLFMSTWLAALAIATDAWSAAAHDGSHDFDFLDGRWRVHHRYLRVTGERREWLDYDGETVHCELEGGWANLDEYLLNRPGGAPYRATAIRAFSPAKQEWAIWWLDQRFPGGPLDPPMLGRFDNGVGTFYSDYVADGKAHTTRFIWSQITPTHARWEQADSADGRKTWETNWVMEFRRIGEASAELSRCNAPAPHSPDNRRN